MLWCLKVLLTALVRGRWWWWLRWCECWSCSEVQNSWGLITLTLLHNGKCMYPDFAAATIAITTATAAMTSILPSTVVLPTITYDWLLFAASQLGACLETASLLGTWLQATLLILSRLLAPVPPNLCHAVVNQV